VPDEHPDCEVKQKSADDGPDVEMVDAPLSPDRPDSQKAQTESEQNMERNVQDIEDRVKRAERWMIGLTAAIAFFGLCAVVVGILQWRVMSGQLGTMDKTLESSERAYLAAGDPISMSHDRVDIPITNYGHVSSKNLTCSISYAVIMNSTHTFRASKDFVITRNDPIAPGPAGYKLEITAPKTPDAYKEFINTGKAYEVMRVSVQYDTGFQSTDTTAFCVGYVGKDIDTWVSCGHTFSGIDLPKEEKQQRQEPNPN
jgi:hypothetical protein